MQSSFQLHVIVWNVSYRPHHTDFNSTLLYLPFQDTGFKSGIISWQRMLTLFSTWSQHLVRFKGSVFVWSPDPPLLCISWSPDPPLLCISWSPDPPLLCIRWSPDPPLLCIRWSPDPPLLCIRWSPDPTSGMSTDLHCLVIWSHLWYVQRSPFVWSPYPTSGISRDPCLAGHLIPPMVYPEVPVSLVTLSHFRYIQRSPVCLVIWFHFWYIQRSMFVWS
jgi:hypothetical protein